VIGITPKAYAIAQRAAKLREGLASSDSVTQAIYEAGYGSSSRFYEKSAGLLGMTPTRYRAGGLNEEIRFAVGESSLGAILVASSTKGVAAIRHCHI
jgi:AraC family transcriptional regulator, regulatory protein of adaptative response / methylated-DNA-[protein]-cysteine methyltransferase